MTGSDFVVESEGHCFFCRHQISYHQSLKVKPKSERTIITSSLHSLQYLARHLKLDMTKVFSEEGLIPPQLLEKVKRSTLKVELCQACTSLSKTFSKLYSKLEKSKMEVACCLELIHGKLREAANNKRDNKMTEGGLMTKMGIVEVLRAEATQKCSRKLSALLPRIKTQKLTTENINRAQLKLKTMSRNVTSAEAEGSGMMPNINQDSKFNDSSEDTKFVDIRGRRHSSNTLSDDDANADVDQMDFAEVDGDDSGSDSNPPMKLKIKCELKKASEDSTSNRPKSNAHRRKLSANPVESFSKAIPPPIHVTREDQDGKSQYIIDSKTGKYKCQLCTKQYTSQNGVQSHHNVSHLGGKFKCSECGQGFGQTSHYNAHYLRVHMDVKYKCMECNKTFTQKFNLAAHQKAAHLGVRAECKFCHKTFSATRVHNSHYVVCTMNPNSPAYNNSHSVI